MSHFLNSTVLEGSQNTCYFKYRTCYLEDQIACRMKIFRKCQKGFYARTHVFKQIITNFQTVQWNGRKDFELQMAPFALSEPQICYNSLKRNLTEASHIHLIRRQVKIYGFVSLLALTCYKQFSALRRTARRNTLPP